MKKSLFLLPIAICLIACKTTIKTLPLEEFETAISENNAIVIDVRTWDEYASGHIVNALNIDWKSDNFAQQITELGMNKDQAIAVYCLHAIRSQGAAEYLVKNGYQNVFQLKGGIEPWTALELKKEFSPKCLIGNWQVCSIVGSDWIAAVSRNGLMLTGYTEPDFCPQITFRENGTIGASVGCNSLGGKYVFEGSTLTLSECCQTEMYCDELDSYEHALFSFLCNDIQVEPYTTDSILLKRNDNQVVLSRFEK